MSWLARQRPQWRRQARENRAFLIMLGLAFLLRVATQLLYEPMVMQWADGIRYTRISPTDFLGDPYSPAGYPAFLRAIFFFSSNLTVTIFIQHLLGLVTGTFLYLMVKRATGIAWLAMIPAGLAMFSGDYLFLEHILMSEALFIMLVVIAMWAALHALGDDHPRRWLAASGLVLIAAALVRPLTLEIPLVLAVWAAIVLGGTLKDRLYNVLASVVPAGLMLAAYLALTSAIGPNTGINEMTGWDLYSRVAPFADCTKFDPPKGTEVLCETTPTTQRPGPFFYTWMAESPGRQHFPVTPEGSTEIEPFARAAILGQPLSYLKAVTKDMIRYIDPSVGDEKVYSGIPYDYYHFEYKTPGEEEILGKQYEEKGYTGVLPVEAPGIEILQAYQTVFHLGGLPVLVMAILALVGIVIDRGNRRAAIVLLSIVAFLMYLLPVLTLSYDVRYGWPPALLMASAAVLSALAIYQRFVARSGLPSSPTEASA